MILNLLKHLFCSPRDLNPQSEEIVPKTTAFANFARRAFYFFKSNKLLKINFGEKGIRTLGTAYNYTTD